MPNSPDILIDPQTLPKQTERLGQADVFSPKSEINFIPGEFHDTVNLHLGRMGSGRFKDQAGRSGIDGMNFQFGQTSYGLTNIHFICENPDIQEVKMLRRTRDEDGKTMAAWSENLIGDKRGSLLTSYDIGAASAERQGWNDFNHPTTILRVKDEKGWKDMRLTSHWKGTADNWSVDADIRTGLLAVKINPAE